MKKKPDIDRFSDHELIDLANSVADNDIEYAIELLLHGIRRFKAKPSFGHFVFNLCILELRQNRLNRAVELADQLLELKTPATKFVNLAARVYFIRGHRSEAERIIRGSLADDPNQTEAFNILGNWKTQEREFDKAIEHYKLAIKNNQNEFLAFSNLANLFVRLSLFKEASIVLDTFERFNSVVPRTLTNLRGIIATRTSDWSFSVYEECNLPTYDTMIVQDNPELLLYRNISYVKDRYGNQTRKKLVFPVTNKIRVAIVSADFHNFPGMRLLLGVIETLCRDNFQWIAISYGPKKRDENRKRAELAFDEFYDVSEKTTEQIVDFTRDLKISIALDRNGHTRESRHDIFLRGIAPIQGSFLGYPSTTGSPAIDFIIADAIVIPESAETFFTERVIRLPRCYQPNDFPEKRFPGKTKLSIEPKPSRQHIVIGCMNKLDKVRPEEFHIWMDVIQEHRNVVLWLLEGSKIQQDNILKEANGRGIDSSFILFLPRVEYVDHLERYKNIDIFVDTFNYNAHTTASDALFMGVPVLTKIGKQFSARVSASLLVELNMEELIAKSSEEYKFKLIELINNEEKRKKVANKLEANIRNSTLFDPQDYASVFETTLQDLYNEYTHKP